MAGITKAVENIKVSSNLWELMLAGAFKYYEERLLAKTFVGNGTITSGLWKLGIGVGVDMLTKGQKGLVKSVSNVGKTALIMDGVEDIVKDLMDRYAPNFMGVGGLNAAVNGANIVETI